MQVEARVTQQPAMHGRCPMRGEVVQYDVHVERGLDARLDLGQERHELLRAMLRCAAREDLPRGDVQRREEVDRPQ